MGKMGKMGRRNINRGYRKLTAWEDAVAYHVAPGTWDDSFVIKRRTPNIRLQMLQGPKKADHPSIFPS